MARYLVINDVTDDYRDFSSRNLLPLDLLLQKVIDTYAFTVPQAAVEMKGMVFPHIRAVIITSNHTSFVFNGDTAKLKRRLEGGIVVDVNVLDKKGKKLEFSEFSTMSQADRNDAWHFRILKPECSNRHLKFIETELSYSFKGFVGHVDESIDKWTNRAMSNLEKFTNPERTCSCGIPMALHETRNDGD